MQYRTLQEFLELVRGERRMDAITHARAHLAPWASQHMQVRGSGSVLLRRRTHHVHVFD